LDQLPVFCLAGLCVHSSYERTSFKHSALPRVRVGPRFRCLLRAHFFLCARVSGSLQTRRRILFGSAPWYRLTLQQGTRALAGGLKLRAIQQASKRRLPQAMKPESRQATHIDVQHICLCDAVCDELSLNVHEASSFVASAPHYLTGKDSEAIGLFRPAARISIYSPCRRLRDF
jgi:hypothetical protein